RHLDRPLRRRVRPRGDQRRRGRPVSADLRQARLRSALRVRIRRDRQRPHDRARRLRDLLELHARRHLVVEGAEPAVPAGTGVDDQNINRPYATVSPALRTVGALSATGYIEYNGLLLKFQRRSANHISFLNSYTFGRAIDLNSDNDGTVTLTNIFDPEYNRGP